MIMRKSPAADMAAINGTQLVSGELDSLGGGVLKVGF
jgi:hypothetical protein